MSKWICNKCDRTFDANSEVHYLDKRCHNIDAEVRCVCEGKPLMAWVPTPGERKEGVDVTFDYAFQVYRDPTGKGVVREDGHFPCFKCQGPSEYEDMDSYYEYYKCVNCGYTTKVN